MKESFVRDCGSGASVNAAAQPGSCVSMHVNSYSSQICLTLIICRPRFCYDNFEIS